MSLMLRIMAIALLVIVVTSSLVWAQGPDGKRAASPSGGREYVIDSPQRGERSSRPDGYRFERRDNDGLSVGQALGLAAGIYLLSRASSGRDYEGGCSMPPPAPGWYDNGRGYGYSASLARAYGAGPQLINPYTGRDEVTGNLVVCPQCGRRAPRGSNFCPQDMTDLRPAIW